MTRPAGHTPPADLTVNPYHLDILRALRAWHQTSVANVTGSTSFAAPPEDGPKSMGFGDLMCFVPKLFQDLIERVAAQDVGHNDSGWLTGRAMDIG